MKPPADERARLRREQARNLHAQYLVDQKAVTVQHRRQVEDAERERAQRDYEEMRHRQYLARKKWEQEELAHALVRDQLLREREYLCAQMERWRVSPDSQNPSRHVAPYTSAE